MPQSDDRYIVTLVQNFLRRIRGVLFLVGVGAMFYFLQGIAQLLLVATLIAYLLSPLVNRLEVHTSRTYATLGVFGSLILLLAILGVVVGPVVTGQFQDVLQRADLQNITGAVEMIDRQLSTVSQQLGGEPLNLKKKLDDGINRRMQKLSSLGQGLLGLVTNVVLVPFMAVLLLRDGPRIKRGLIRFVPNRYFEFSLEALHKIDIQLRNYLRGLVFEISVISILSIPTLWLLEVPAYVLIGILAGITTVIPYAGSLLGGFVGFLLKVATTGQVASALPVLLAFLVIQIADEAFIQPLVFAQAVDLHPLEVLIAVWIAAQFFGVIGMVLAIPVTSAGKVVISEGAALIQQYQFS
jgi:putative permease